MEVKGFSDYLIYDDGRVWSKISKIFLKESSCPKGYKSVGLRFNEQRTTKKIHRLVAEHFIENKDNLKEVDHINRNKGDNRMENLRWVDRTTNLLNQTVRKNNKLGIKNICFMKRRNRYQYKKSINGITDIKYFKTLEEAIEYKSKVILN